MIKCLSGESERFLVYLQIEYDELDSSIITPVVRKKVNGAVMGPGKNHSGLVPLLPGTPAACCVQLQLMASLQSGGAVRAEPDAHPQCVSSWLRTHSFGNSIREETKCSGYAYSH